MTVADSARARYAVSGIGGGSDGSAGLGIARSIRLFDPDASIVGVGYSTASSALHSETFDEIHCFATWDQVHQETWIAQLRNLTSDTMVIPGLSLDAQLLAQELTPSANLLTPDERCLSFLSRPAEKFSRWLDVPVPPSLHEHSATAIGKFLRRCEHGAWVRGELGGSEWVRRTPDALRAGEWIEASWTTPWYMEEHIPGQACSIAFAAVDGALVDAVLVSTTEVVSGGTTWSGGVTELSASLHDRLQACVQETGWTGGGEVELIRTWSGELRLVGIKPSLPSWIYGAALAGFNVVRSLASGSRVRTQSASGAFTRLVVESKAPPAVAGQFRWAGSQVPTRDRHRPATARTLVKHRSAVQEREFDPVRDDQATKELIDLLEQGVFESDRRNGSLVVDKREFERRVAQVQDALGPQTTIGYSIKTFPHADVMRTAARLGLVAEATSQDELAAAVRAGFKQEDAILNGPAKWWPAPAAVTCAVAFADSLDELRMLGDGRRQFPLDLKTVGVRLKPRFDSRFGIEMNTAAAIEGVVHQLTRTADQLDATWGIHFHHAEAVVGKPLWHREIERLARVTQQLTDAIGSPPAVVDVGGGWHAEDFEDYCSSVADARQLFPSVLAGVTRLATEPGRVLTQFSGIRFATVLARRTDATDSDVVVDIGHPEFEQDSSFDRPVAVLHGGRWTPMRRGTSRVLGRTCMESDVLFTNVDTTDLQIGTTFAIGSCGAYDYSMCYEFGRGSAHE